MLWNCWDVEGGCTPIYRHIHNIVLGKNLLYLSVLVTLTVQPCTKLTNTMRKRTQIIFATKQPFKTEFATRVQHDWITFLGKLIVYMSDLLNFVSLLQKGKLKHVYLSHFSRPQWLSQCKERFGPWNNPWSGGNTSTHKWIHPSIEPIWP